MSKISKMIDDVTGKTQKDQETRERFTFLQKMAEGKSSQFKDELRVMLANKSKTGQIEVVGDVAFEYHSGHHVNISTSCDDSIMDAVSDFFKGSDGLKDGFEKIVKHGLSGLIGNTSLGETQEDMFFVFPENYSIVRVDVKAYRYNFSTKGLLADNVENVFVYSMCKSIVNHKTVSPDYLMHAVVDMMGQDAAIKDVMDFIKQLVACWKLLDECQVDGEEVLRSAVEHPGEVPDYIARSADLLGLTAHLASNDENADLPLTEDIATLTAEEVLRRAAAFEGEPVKGLHETDGVIPPDGRLTPEQVFGK